MKGTNTNSGELIRLHRGIGIKHPLHSHRGAVGITPRQNPGHTRHTLFSQFRYTLIRPPPPLFCTIRAKTDFWTRCSEYVRQPNEPEHWNSSSYFLIKNTVRPFGRIPLSYSLKPVLATITPCRTTRQGNTSRTDVAVVSQIARPPARFADTFLIRLIKTSRTSRNILWYGEFG